MQRRALSARWEQQKKDAGAYKTNVVWTQAYAHIYKRHNWHLNKLTQAGYSKPLLSQ